MLSRVAENIYWMSRYVERADNLARLVWAHQTELLDITTSSRTEHEWHPLLEVTSMGDAESDEDVVTYLVSSRKNLDSIFNCIHFARENARAARDKISSEMWMEINSLWLDLKEIPVTGQDRNRLICEAVMRSAYQFAGISTSTLNRADTFSFAQLGQAIERADKTSRMVDLPHFLPDGSAGSAWTTMLRACSAIDVHRSRYGLAIDEASVTSILLFSSTFPRSFRFSIKLANHFLRQISGASAGEYLNQAERTAGMLLARVSFEGVEEISKLKLHDYIDSLQIDLNQLGGEIANTFFQLKAEAPARTAEEYLSDQLHTRSRQQQLEDQQ